jgi:hypothetical protein
LYQKPEAAVSSTLQTFTSKLNNPLRNPRFELMRLEALHNTAPFARTEHARGELDSHAVSHHTRVGLDMRPH